LEEYLSFLGNSIKEALLSRSLNWDHNLCVHWASGKRTTPEHSISYLVPLYTTNFNQLQLPHCPFPLYLNIALPVPLLVRSSPFVW
jgi:hypothetical protein